MPGKEFKVQSLAFARFEKWLIHSWLNLIFKSPYFYLLLVFGRVVTLETFLKIWAGMSTFPIILNILNFLSNFEGLIPYKFFWKYFFINILTISRNSEHLSFFQTNIFVAICLWNFLKSIRQIRLYFPD